MICEQKFYEIIRKRSDDNEKALCWLMQEQNYSLVGSIIRMELDSLFRLCYYKSKAATEKQELLTQFARGKRWYDGKNLVTDSIMVDYLSRVLLLGWARPIYKIGCAFIHLSPYHDWGNTEPTQNLTNQERQEIAESVNEHVRCGLYKKYKETMPENFNFFNLIEVAEDVFYKLRDNLLCELEKGED